MAIPALPMTPALARRLCGRPLVLLLDVDGTLAPIAPRPEYAVVPLETRAVLTELTALPFAHVILVSGRAADDARRLVGVDDLWVIGNHGFEIARPNEPPTSDDRVQPYLDSVAAAVERSRAIAQTDPGIIVEDKRSTLSVHYRLAHPRVVPELTASVENVARELGLRVTFGKEVLELRPPVDVDKGTASVALANELGALRSGASLLCAGDDRTDEDAFRALRAAQPACVTVRVGAVTNETAQNADLMTLAEFRVADTDEMRELLGAVLSLQRNGTAAQ
ncbi:MAG TPA: trehalose-phosphatase [Gemmatimonadaceae bacterium]|jgi:trehalose 6-phosphate phosphatase